MIDLKIDIAETTVHLPGIVVHVFADRIEVTGLIGRLLVKLGLVQVFA